MQSARRPHDRAGNVECDCAIYRYMCWTIADGRSERIWRRVPFNVGVGTARATRTMFIVLRVVRCFMTAVRANSKSKNDADRQHTAGRWDSCCPCHLPGLWQIAAHAFGRIFRTFRVFVCFCIPNDSANDWREIAFRNLTTDGRGWFFRKSPTRRDTVARAPTGLHSFFGACDGPRVFSRNPKPRCVVYSLRRRTGARRPPSTVIIKKSTDRKGWGRGDKCVLRTRPLKSKTFLHGYFTTTTTTIMYGFVLSLDIKHRIGGGGIRAMSIDLRRFKISKTKKTVLNRNVSFFFKNLSAANRWQLYCSAYCLRTRTWESETTGRQLQTKRGDYTARYVGRF